MLHNVLVVGLPRLDSLVLGGVGGLLGSCWAEYYGGKAVLCSARVDDMW